MTQLADRPATPDSADPTAEERTGFPSPRMPHRVMVRAFRSLHHASDAVERLARRHRIPRERVTVVARGLSWSRRETGDVMLSGARTGAIVGALTGLALYVLGFARGDLSAFLPIVIGTAMGAVAGAAVATLARRRAGADPSGEAGGRLKAAQYDLLVDDEVAPRAKQALAAAEEE